MNRAIRSNEQNGHTLIEVCVAMSIGSALMLLAVGMLHQAMTLASTARMRAESHRMFDRLEQDFRRDVHETDEASVTDPQHLRLRRNDGRVVSYDTQDKAIRRSERIDGNVVRSDEYRLVQPIRVTFETMTQPSRVAVLFASEASAIGPAHSPDRQISAVVGRTLAHQRAEIDP